MNARSAVCLIPPKQDLNGFTMVHFCCTFLFIMTQSQHEIKSTIFLICLHNLLLKLSPPDISSPLIFYPHPYNHHVEVSNLSTLESVFKKLCFLWQKHHLSVDGGQNGEKKMFSNENILVWRRPQKYVKLLRLNGLQIRSQAELLPLRWMRMLTDCFLPQPRLVGRTCLYLYFYKTQKYNST